MGKAFMHRGNVKESDFYQTPYMVTQRLLEREKFSDCVLEPACGEGAIARVLEKNGYEVIATDIRGRVMTDFYDIVKKDYDIITNPPYGKEADKFVLHAKKICKRKFAFLLRTNYLSGQERYDLGIFDNLKTVYVFTRMPDLRQPLRDDGKYKTAGIVYAWFVWDMQYGGEMQIKHIDCSMDIARVRK